MTWGWSGCPPPQLSQPVGSTRGQVRGPKSTAQSPKYGTAFPCPPSLTSFFGPKNMGEGLCRGGIVRVLGKFSGKKHWKVSGKLWHPKLQIFRYFLCVVKSPAIYPSSMGERKADANHSTTGKWAPGVLQASSRGVFPLQYLQGSLT